MVHGGEAVTLQGLEWSQEGGGPAGLCCGTEGPAVCLSGLWTGACSGVDPSVLTKSSSGSAGGEV